MLFMTKPVQEYLLPYCVKYHMTRASVQYVIDSVYKHVVYGDQYL